MYKAKPSPALGRIEDLRKFVDDQLREIERVFAAIGRNPYTPLWSSTGTQPVLGNGELTGSFVEIGNWMEVQFRLSIGSTTTFGTGTYFFSLPRGAPAGMRSWNGTALAQDISAVQDFIGATHMNADAAAQDLVNVRIHNAGLMSPTVPFTWAVGDQLVCTLGFPLR